MKFPAEVMGEQTYSMRLWLRPDRMASLGLTVSEVQAARNKIPS